MTKICHITPFFCEQYGGTDRYVDTITKYQQNDGLDVTVLTTTRLRNKAGLELNNGIKIVRVFSYKNVWRINPVAFMLPFLMKSKIDIIHIHSYIYFSSNQAALIGKIRKIPLLLHLHGGVGYPPYRTSIIRRTAKSFYDKTLGHLTVSSADLIGSVSKSDLRRIKSIYNLLDSKLTYLPNTVDTKLFKPLKKDQEDITDSFTILYVGDIEPWKGIGFLEKWIRKRRLKIEKKLRFRFIGQGSCTQRIKKLEKICKNSKIAVEYLGEKTHTEIPKFLAEAQALILPSYWEGLPTVILEAMAAEVPVVTTPIGDIPQVVRHKETGLLINLNFKSLDKAIDFLIHNPDKVEKMGKQAHQIISKEFASDIVHKKILKTYWNLTNGEK